MPDDYTEPVNDRVRTLLRPAGRGVDTSALVQASTALATEIAAAPTRAHTHRRRRAVATLFATLVVLVPTTAAAYAWTTHTGIFGQPGRYTEDVDTSEVLDVCAPDFPATARTLMPQNLLLPDRATAEQAFDSVLHSVTRDCRDGDGIGARMQSTGVTASAEGYAWCSWVNVYLAQPETRNKAANALKLYANSDITNLVDADGGMTRRMNQIADAAARGEVEQVRDEQQVNCGSGDFGWRP